MKKYRLTNPFEHPKPAQASFMQMSKVMSKYQWLFFICVIIVSSILFFFVGRYFGRRKKVTPQRNQYLEAIGYYDTEEADINDQNTTNESSSNDPPLKV